MVVWLRLGLALAFLGACGRIGFGAGPSVDSDASLDATVDTSPSIDAPGSGMFSPPQLVPGLAADGSSDRSPTLTGDRLEIYFESDRPNGLGSGDIWTSLRASTVEAWAPPTPVAELNTASFESAPEVSADGLVMFIASDRLGGAGGLDIWTSQRPDRSASWATPTHVPELSSTADDLAATTASTPLVVVLETGAGGAGGSDLVQSIRTNLGAPWSAPLHILEINTTFEDRAPLLGPLGHVIFFDSTRPGGAGGSDLFSATRAASSETFDPPTALTELSSPSTDRDIWVSEDLDYCVFISDRSGQIEFYEAFAR